MDLLNWRKENREKYVNSWKASKMSVYSGSGMVIGCAEAGKTTLVKKLKGIKDLTPEHTMGLEIHPHVFKLDNEESTIMGILLITLTIYLSQREYLLSKLVATCRLSHLLFKYKIFI